MSRVPSSAPRVGDRELARSTGPKSGRASRVTRLSEAIATPLGILITLPVLVALVGLFLTIVGQRALHDSNLRMARDRIDEETALLARSIGVALDQSDPVLDRLGALAREHDPSRPVAPVAQTLCDLMQGRPGVSYISIAFPDGTFQGAYRDDRDGKIRFQDSRISARGTVVKRFDLVGHAALAQLSEEHNNYDPRTRPYYALAVNAPGRVWTKPYPFFKTHYTGISRAEAIRERGAAGASELHAVITVDFDVSALSSVLGRISLGGATAILYSNDGTLLAYPRASDAIGRLPLRSDRPLSYTDLDDPLLTAFFEKLVQPAPKATSSLSNLDANGSRLLVARQTISSDPALDWSVAALVPEAQVLSPLYQHQRQSLLAALLATLTAVAIAWLFARHILRARHEIAEARAEAAEAVARARELGSYRLVERLGKGGMGEVWRAEHRLLVRQAAIKLISVETDSALDTREVQERFRREAQSLATLRSRNTIELFDYGVTADGTFFYVMELLDGMDLESLVLKFGPQPVGRVIEFLIQACNSLAEAHDAGLVHRDIKPANLYVCRIADEVDVIKVLDFGLVRAALQSPEEQRRAALTSGTMPVESGESTADSSDPRLTQLGQSMGTPAYMAPEQALAHEADGRADLYALGCVAYWLLTGRLVFDKSGSLPMMMAHLTEAPPDLTQGATGFVPAELARLLERCLGKQPGDRPENARALAAELKAIALPESERWTDERAQAWWQEHCPIAMNPQLSVAPNAAEVGAA